VEFRNSCSNLDRIPAPRVASMPTDMRIRSAFPTNRNQHDQISATITLPISWSLGPALRLYRSAETAPQTCSERLRSRHQLGCVLRLPQPRTLQLRQRRPRSGCGPSMTLTRTSSYLTWGKDGGRFPKRAGAHWSVKWLMRNGGKTLSYAKQHLSDTQRVGRNQSNRRASCAPVTNNFSRSEVWRRQHSRGSPRVMITDTSLRAFLGQPSASIFAGSDRKVGAEKKLPLAQEPLPGSLCSVFYLYEKTDLTDALRSPLIHNFSKACASVFGGSSAF
jgi:hypothetical protein